MRKDGSALHIHECKTCSKQLTVFSNWLRKIRKNGAKSFQEEINDQQRSLNAMNAVLTVSDYGRRKLTDAEARLIIKIRTGK